jgi:adenosylcobinamide-GDP ribazoletransferase
MNSLFVAASFLTRLPVRPHKAIDSADVARSAGWFPLVGAALGGLYCLAAALLKGHLPALVIAGGIVLLDAALTGALHFDGLADTADGFGGGRKPDDVLRIMHDHNIGSFGGVALAVCIAIKVAAYGALLDRNDWIRAFITAPMLGRWSVLILTAAFRYAGTRPAVTAGMGKGAVAFGTAVTMLALAVMVSLRPFAAAITVILVTACFGLYCRKRIGGITGDTLGANVELSECASLLVFLWAR